MRALFIAMIAMIAFAATTANAASVTPNKDYQEYYLNFDDAESVQLTVQGPRYRAARPHTMVNIQQVADGLYVVNQENLYYPAIAIFPPLPIVTLRDTASTVIEKGESYFVRILVPANLEVLVAEVPDHFGPICMAYWQGFVYDRETDSCTSIGASGCGNPFEFTTLRDCQVGNLLEVTPN